MDTPFVNNDVFWYRRDTIPLDALQGDAVADVVVVGGGVAGLSCAQEAARQGLSVVLLERDVCGGGASGKSAGFILSDTEVELNELTHRFGKEKAKKIWDFSVEGVRKIRDNLTAHSFACEYLPQDALFTAFKKDEAHIEKEFRALQELSYPSSLCAQPQLKGLVNSDRFSKAVRCPGSFGINPFAYARELVNMLLQMGVRVYEQTPATRIRPDGVDTPHGSVRAKRVVVCVDRFAPELGVLRDEVYHVQTFLGITKPLSVEAMRSIFPEQPFMVWDSDLIYTYFRPTPDNRILIGGGDMIETCRREQEQDTSPFAHKLHQYLAATFPGIPFEFETVWSGMLGVSKDLLPVMGADAEHESIWYAGAATGLSWATALGIYAAQRLTQKRDEYDELFAWNRAYPLETLAKVLPIPATFALCNTIVEMGM